MTTPPPTSSGTRAREPEPGALAPVIPLGTVPEEPVREPPAIGRVAVVLVALALAIAPLVSGYYDQSAWAPLALGSVVLLVLVALVSRPRMARPAAIALTGLGLLLALSAASMLWAESRQSAWTSANRLALYTVLFTLGVLTLRELRTARMVMVILGAPALLTAVVLDVLFITGGGSGAFHTSRLDSPIGYINGTAGLLAIGIWPWIAAAESELSRRWRAAAIAGASLIAATAVLTQARAAVLATVIAGLFVLVASPGRTRRAVNLIIVLASVAVSLRWTLAVYHGGLMGSYAPPPSSTLQAAGWSILAGAVTALIVWLVVIHRLERSDAAAVARIGRALSVAAVAVVLGGVAIGHSTLANQWRAFSHNEVSQSSSSRFLDAGGFRYDLWRVALDEFRDHPFGGVGAGNYDTFYYRLRHNPEYVLQPHSLELQMAAELGIGGLVGIVLLIGGVGWAGLARRGTLAAEDPPLRVAAAGIFVAWLAATSVDWLYDIPGLAGAAMLAGAALVVPTPRPVVRGAGVARRRGRPRPHQLALAGGLAVLALVAASVGRQYAANRYASSGAAEIARSPRQAIHTLETAESLDPYALTTFYSIASAYAALDDYAGARDTLLAAERLEPHNYVTPALLGDLATRRGDYRTAASEYARALALNPREPSLRASLDAARIQAG